MKFRSFGPSTLVAAFAICIALSSGTSAAASSKFDGVWSVRMVAKSGSCPESSFPIRVLEGLVSLPLPGATVEGAIRRDGSVKLNISNSIQVVNATGTIVGSTGSGRWRSPTASCDGTWTAQKG